MKRLVLVIKKGRLMLMLLFMFSKVYFQEE